jgi:hypothetical protein
MDIEQLKLILSTVESVSGTASDIAIYWVIGNYLLPFISSILTASLWVGLIGFAIWRITTTISLMNEWIAIGKTLVEAQQGFSSRNFISSTEKQAVMEIMDLIVTAKSKKPY